MSKNWSYTIHEEGHPHNGKTLWSGRYCAVCGVVLFYNENTGETFALANKRGNGTPDYQGFWNLPCGFLEANESGQQGVAREVYEETGVKMEIDRLGFVHECFFPGDTEFRKGNIVHEISFFFYMKVPKDFEPVCYSFTEDGNPEYLKWITTDETQTFYPEFFRTELKNPSRNVKQYVTRDV